MRKTISVGKIAEAADDSSCRLELLGSRRSGACRSWLLCTFGDFDLSQPQIDAMPSRDLAPKPPLRKELGQHHLVSGEICRPLIHWLQRFPGPVVEIGPGGGVLTLELTRSARPVLAVEFDPAWAFRLATTTSAHVVVADARDLAWEALPNGAAVVGNLPYNLSTSIIEGVLDRAPAGVGLAFLVQLEVAQRLSARPSTSDYGSLSVIAQSRTNWQLLGRVRPGSFRPPPKVQSAFVGSEGLAQPPGKCDGVGRPIGDEWWLFKEWVRAAFSRRRKTLVNSLRGRVSRLPGGLRVTWDRPLVEGLLRRIDRAPRSRAEELSVREYLQLWQYLAHGELGALVVDAKADDR